MIDHASVRTYSRFVFHFAWLLHEQSVPRATAEKVLAQASLCFIEEIFQTRLATSEEFTDLHQHALQEAVTKYWGEGHANTGVQESEGEGT